MTSGHHSPQVVILCGGKGTRLREYTEIIPKVLVEVGGRPILWHIMKSYATAGYSDFVLALGYLGLEVHRHFAGSTSGGRGKAGVVTEEVTDDDDRWRVAFADTGQDTNTGGRIKRLEPILRGGSFFATYGDGVSDIDHRQLLAFHRSHGRLATMTVVRPRLTFGLVDLDGDSRVCAFREKPQIDAWINGGFFVFEPGVLDYLDDDSILEGLPLQRLAADRELVAYQHSGFWGCMDTYKDNIELNAAWSSGQAPWCTWDVSRGVLESA
jgi:glucose-1-phosphate cytidylyltransferase